MKDDIARPDFADEAVRPIGLAGFVGLRTPQVGPDIVTIGNLTPIPLFRVSLPPVRHVQLLFGWI
jgi:hypothetical protein